MFGNNAVQSSWANPQQNQQQQPQQNTSAFGQPNAFGSGAFGSTSAFGQPQSQPQANPMFGNLGAPATNPVNSGFGAFANNASTGTNTSVFGAPKPATGFSAFGGGTSAFGGGGAFGSNNSNAGPSTGTSAFGSTTNTGGGFGGNVFGQKPATGFGTTNSSIVGQFDNVAPVTTGTANPPFSAYNEKDVTNTSLTLQYQSITAMPHYRGTSFEELRYQDYQQSRKTANTSAFGQSGFGSVTNAQPSTGVFGAPQQNQTQPAGTSIFGAGNTGTNAFGSTSTQPSTNAFSAFGQNTNQNPGTGTGAFGVFGQNNNQQQQQPSTGFSAFSQPQQPSAFGSTNNAFGSTGFGQNKPATGFGASGSNTANAFGGTSGFGSNTNQQQPSTGMGAFGQAQQQPSMGTFSAFGNNNNTNKPSIFGQPSQTANQPTTGFGFGNAQQPQQSQPTNSIFGQPTQNQPNQTSNTGVFGGTPTQQPLIGNTTFGGAGQQQNQQQPAQNTGTSIFGLPKPVMATNTGGGGLFSNFAQGGGSAFGGTGQQSGIFGQSLGQSTQQPTMGTGAFGLGATKPAAPALGISTSAGQTGSGLFGSMFNPTGTLNASASTPGAQGTLTASIAQPIAANLPIFSMLPPGPRAVALDQQPKKKSGFFVDVPTRSPVPRLQLGYTPASTKLRGFASSTSNSTGAPNGNPFAASLALTSGKSNALTLSTTSSDPFLGKSGSPALGSGGRQSVKKLVVDKKIQPTDLFSKSGSLGSWASPSKVQFNPALSQALREKEVARELAASSSSPNSHPVESPTPAARNARAAPASLIEEPKSPSKESADATSPSEGEYYVKPDLQTLIHTGYSDLVSFKDLIVGRVGYGEIHFLEPVDLTGLTKLGALLGEIVRFDDKECSVYPDSEDVEKPAAGAGLNVPARITLMRCWPVDKATRQPIKDEKHPLAVKHVKRLRSMKDTQFESFDFNEGKWTFTVDHF